MRRPLDDPTLRVPDGLLGPDEVVHWRVGRQNASDGSEPGWSAIAVFETAPDETSWGGSWITAPDWATPSAEHNGPPPVLGRDVAIDGVVSRARLSLSAPGSIELRLNGTNPDGEVLGLGYSVEHVRLPARTFDVTGLLGAGLNSLRVTVAGGASWVPRTADGRYTKLTTAALAPRLLARLRIEYDDGRAEEVVTDADWSATTGPVRMSHWYGGEDIDGRIPEHTGPIDHTWDPVAVIGSADLHPVWWVRRPPLRIVGRLEGTVVATTDDSVVFDFGVNVAGWPVIDLAGGVDGQVLEARPAELLADGGIDQRTVGTPLWDSYLARDGNQTWHPRHVYHGFRYVEVTGAPAERIAAHAAVIRADNESIGSFDTDDAFIATLHRIIDRAVQGNMYSVFTDCPSREKLGWIEQLHLCFGLLARTYDVEAHLRDSLDLMRDAQHGGGLVPSIVPQTTDFSGNDWAGDPTAFVDDVNWGGAIGFVSWLHWREYGDRRVLEENWGAITRYLAHLDARSVDGLLDFGLGDWVALDESTPASMVATQGYIHLLRVCVDIARTLGHDEAECVLTERLGFVTDRFIAAFHCDGVADWGSGSQASLAIALDLGVVTPADDAAVFAALLQSIAAADGRLTVGENSWPALIRVLHARGRGDLIDRMVRSDDGPGYGLQIRLGATALAETWRGASGAMFENSQNHFMLGMIHDWMAEDVAGLAQAPGSVGWREAEMRPHRSPHGNRSSIGQETGRGAFALAWYDDARRLQVEIPAGARARVTLPPDWSAAPARTVELESGRWEWSE